MSHRLLHRQLFGLCPTIIEMYDNMKDNDERCRRIADRVRDLEGLVLTVKERGSGRNSGAVEKALKELHTILKHAEKLVSKFSKNNRLKQFMMSGSIGAKFSEVNQRLNENFQMLSGALQVEQSDILHKVYETALGRPYTPLPNPQQHRLSPLLPCLPPTSWHPCGLRHLFLPCLSAKLQQLAFLSPITPEARH